MAENLREIINGTMIPQFNSRKVSLTGLVTSVNPNGLTFDMRACDDVLVKVNLRKPNRDTLLGQVVEVHGTAQGSSTVICDDMVQFSAEDAENFDTNSHNVLCTILHTVTDLYKTSE